jgi:hypothetical protein
VSLKDFTSCESVNKDGPGSQLESQQYEEQDLQRLSQQISALALCIVLLMGLLWLVE